MLSFEECREIAQEFVDKLNRKELAFCKRINEPERFIERALSSWFDESQNCYAFVYNSKKYLESNNLKDCLVGQGPMIIDRRNGKIIETGSAYPNAYLENYEMRGDPYKNVGSTVLIYALQSGQTIAAIKVLRQHSNLGLRDAKSAIEKVLEGGEFQIDIGSNEIAEQLVTDLALTGYLAKRL